MRRMSLLGSVHNPNGVCNSGELYKILRAIHPDVIFMEIRPNEFDFHFDQGNNECRAVKKLREARSFDEVFVDRHEITREFMEVLAGVFDYVADNNEEFDHRKTLEEKEIALSGFKFVNSDSYDKLMMRLREIEDLVVGESRNQNKIRILQTWRRLTEAREREMVRNIYDYSRVKEFENGVFLFGASHRSGLIKEIGKHSLSDPGLIEWKFSPSPHLWML